MSKAKKATKPKVSKKTVKFLRKAAKLADKLGVPAIITTNSAIAVSDGNVHGINLCKFSQSFINLSMLGPTFRTIYRYANETNLFNSRPRVIDVHSKFVEGKWDVVASRYSESATMVLSKTDDDGNWLTHLMIFFDVKNDEVKRIDYCQRGNDVMYIDCGFPMNTPIHSYIDLKDLWSKDIPEDDASEIKSVIGDMLKTTV